MLFVLKPQVVMRITWPNSSKDNDMKKFVSSIVLCGLAAGCSNSGSLPVRNGPQEIHPSDWQRMQNGTMEAPSSNLADRMMGSSQSDTCGATQLQYLVAGPSSATRGLNISGDSRHYGSNESVATNTPSRLNIVHSGTAVESVSDPNSTVVRVFCG